jgi:hypothetical protein
LCKKRLSNSLVHVTEDDQVLEFGFQFSVKFCGLLSARGGSSENISPTSGPVMLRISSDEQDLEAQP